MRTREPANASPNAATQVTTFSDYYAHAASSASSETRKVLQAPDCRKLRRKVVWYHETRDRAHSHGANALKSVEDRFSTRKTTDAYRDLYARALAR